MKDQKKEIDPPVVTPEETAEEKYYVIKELHLHNCQGVVILQQGQPTPPKNPPGHG